MSAAAQDDLTAVWTYHRDSRHRPEGYAPSPGFLDWDSQPNPFRLFPGALRCALPLVDQPAQTPLVGVPDVARLGLFCELAAGLSSWKSLDGARWSQRTRPSSGNLHPTETTLLLFGAKGEGGLAAGVYHYDAYGHLLELRRQFSDATAEALRQAYPDHWGCLGLSTLSWREEWKYGLRAYRYCQLDVGHALGAAQAAALVAFGDVMGQGVCCDPRPSDQALEALFGLVPGPLFVDAEPERPDLLAWLGAVELPDLGPLLDLSAADAAPWHGRASRVSAESLKWPEVAAVEAVTVKRQPMAATFSRAQGHSLSAALIRQRRSAQRMDPAGTLSAEDFSAILGRLTPGGDPLWNAFPFDPAVVPLVMVHGVEGLEPGLYLYNRAPERWADLQCRLVEPITAVPGWDGLVRLGLPRSLRKEASQLSCYQGLAGRGAVAWAFLADMGGVLAAEGAWAYRRLHWEAGVLGQILYLAAEQVGLRGTGIGCFMDAQSAGLALGDQAADGRWQTLYHFTIGRPLPDARLQSEQPYGHLPTARRLLFP
jgi:SagB-type dehydrogenase family enzyme